MFKIKVTGYKSLFLVYFVSYFYLYIALQFTILMMKKSKWDIWLVTAMTSVAQVTNCCANYLSQKTHTTVRMLQLCSSYVDGRLLIKRETKRERERGRCWAPMLRKQHSTMLLTSGFYAFFAYAVRSVCIAGTNMHPS
jgi:hypothetical protein